MNLHKIFFFLMALVAGVAATGCIEDGVDTSPSSQPEFSTDTLDMGVAFTQQGTPTRHFMVYNRHDKILSISNIALREGKSFRLNVDGTTGRTFQNIEIRPNDSIYVFVEATLPAQGSGAPAPVSDVLDFTTNGVTRSVVVTATAQDVNRLTGVVVEADQTWGGDTPYQIFDSLVVAPGATLTLQEGVRLYFHDKALLRVYGTLVSRGTAQAPVVMSGDRMDNIVTDLSFDLLASQWDGIAIMPGSRGNALSHTEVRNTAIGVQAGTGAELELVNCNLRNSGSTVLLSSHADVRAYGTVLSEAVGNVALLVGGTAEFNHCTFANYYLRKYPTDPLVHLTHTGLEGDLDEEYEDLPLLQARFDNCILYGLSSDVSPGDLVGAEVYFRRCLFKSAGEDDENFIESIWDADPLYLTVREDYVFDYRLKAESPAAAAGDPALTHAKCAVDFYGVPRDPASPSLGAYQYVEMPEQGQ